MRPLRPLFLVALLGAAAALAYACARSDPAERLRLSPPRNLLLVTLDTLRADRLACYGYAGAHTPHLDRLAAGGVRFERAVAPAPLTLPSHTSLLTGRDPAAHGVRSNGRDRLADDVPTLAEALAERIPHRAAIVGSVSLDRLFGLGRGFGDYDDRMPAAPRAGFLTQRERRAEEVARLAADWLRSAREPFFLWVHLFDPHAPYDPPPEWRSRTGHPYDDEIAYADDAVGRIVDALEGAGALERTLVVVAADHGEGLMDHGEPTHGVFLYDSTVRVPLIVRYPAGLPAGRVVPGVVRLIDVLPTVLDIWGLPPPEGTEGVSLVPLLTGARDDLDLEAELETVFPALQYGWSPLRGLRGRDWKYVAGASEELYDLAADPGESVNLAPREPERAARYRARLAAAGGETPGEAARPGAELRRQLESLGYIGGHEAAPPAGSGPDPLRMAHLLPAIERGASAFEAREFAASADELRTVLEENPQNVFARRLLARSFLGLGRPEEGVREYERLLEHAPRDAEALNTLGTLALRAGRLDEAERRLREASDASPWDPRIRSNLALVRVRRGDLRGAEEMMARVVREDPRSAEAALNLAALYRRTGRPREAERTLRDLLERSPGEPSALRALAGLLREQGRAEEATRLLRDAPR